MAKVSRTELKLYRKSGAPVDLSDRQKYDDAWKLFFDKAQAKAGLNMLKLQRFLRYGERVLIKKHNVQVAVPMPKSAAAWTKLVSTYEDCPIMLARSADGKEIVGIIMDQFGE